MKYGDCSEKDALKTNSSLLMGNKVAKTFHLNYGPMYVMYVSNKIVRK